MNYETMIKDLEQIKAEANQLEGQLKRVLAQIKEETGCDGLKPLSKSLQRMKKELIAGEKKLKELYRKLRAAYPQLDQDQEES